MLLHGLVVGEALEAAATHELEVVQLVALLVAQQRLVLAHHALSVHVRALRDENALNKDDIRETRNSP